MRIDKLFSEFPFRTRPNSSLILEVKGIIRCAVFLLSFFQHIPITDLQNVSETNRVIAFLMFQPRQRITDSVTPQLLI